MLRSSSLVLLVFTILIASCITEKGFQGEIGELGPYSWNLLDGGQFTIEYLSKSRATVLITMDPECPMCANYSKVINDLELVYREDSVSFYGIFTTDFYSEQEIRGFALKYNVDIPFILDPTNRLAQFLDAKVTPEVFVFDRNSELVYQGLIDDWAIALGKKRKKANVHYLTDALDAVRNGRSPEIGYTKAVGCIIEYDIE